MWRSSRVWAKQPMEDITLVIADPEEEVVVRARQIMACWASAGLLKRFLWWVGDDIARWSDGEDEVDLYEEIAKEAYQAIRIIAFMPVPDGQASSTVRGKADALRHTIKQAAASDVYSLTLLAPATKVTGIPASSLASDWDANLVVADEDRVTSGHAATFICPDELAPHAAGVLAAAAGLWRGMRAAPFDDDSEGAGLQDARVRVVRSFARVVRSHELVSGVAGEVFALTADEDWLDVALSATPARNPEAVVAKAADEYLAGPGALLTWAKRSDQGGGAGPLPASVGQAFKALWGFMRGRVAAYPGEFVDQVKESAAVRIAKLAQGQTFGQESLVSVTFGGRPMFESPHSEGLGPDTIRFIDAVYRWLGEEPRFTAFEDTWSALRALAFGLVDGGPLPEGCTEPRLGRNRMIVTQIAHICGDPDSEPFLPPPQAQDEDATQLIMEGLKDSGEDLEATEKEPGEPQSLRLREPDVPRMQRAVLVCTVVGLAGLVGAVGAWVSGARVEITAGLALLFLVGLLGAFAAVYRRRRRRYQPDSHVEPPLSRPEARSKDVTRPKSSLLSIVRARITEGFKDAAKELEAAEKELGKGLSPRLDEPDVSRARRAVLVCAVVGLAGLVGAVGAWASGARVEIIAGLALLAPVGFLGAFVAVYRHLRRRFQLAHHRNEELERYLGAKEKAERSARALVRLTTAYELYTDWDRIICSVLHSALTPGDERPEDPLDSCELVVPKAVSIAKGQTDREHMRHLAFGVGKISIRRGWIGNCFAEFMQREMRLLHKAWWRAENEPAPDPDVDHIARRHLVRVLANKESDPPLATWMRGRVADFLSTCCPEDLFTSLESVQGQTLSLPPEEFLTAIFPPPDPGLQPDGFAYRLWRLRTGGPAVKIKSKAWKPTTVDLPLSQTEVASVDGTPRAGSAAFTLFTARLDATQPMSLTDLAIFTANPRTSPPDSEPSPTGLG